MAINRIDRFGLENISAITEIEEYINTNYLKLIQNKIDILKLKRIEIEDKISLYTQLNTANNLLIEQLKLNVKYITITNNQTITKPLIIELNAILRNLNTLLLYKDLITLNNLDYKKDLYSIGKVSITDGLFTQLQVEDPSAIKCAINKQYLTTQLDRLEQPPKPLPPLKYLGTDAVGNLIWI